MRSSAPVDGRRTHAAALGAAAAAALVAVSLALAAPAAASPSPGDAAASRALAATASFEKRQTTIVAALRRASVTNRIGPVLRQTRALASRGTAAARRAKRTHPTSAQGKRVRRFAVQIAVLYRQWATTVATAAGAAAGGRASAARRLGARADTLNRLIDRRRDAAERIILPDPTAAVGALEFLGFTVAPSTSASSSAPIAAPNGGVIAACTAADRAIGIRYILRGVVGRSRVDFAIVEPSGLRRPFPGIIAEPGNDGHTFNASTTRDVTNGVWRWQASANGTVLLDVAVTRACP